MSRGILFYAPQNLSSNDGEWLAGCQPDDCLVPASAKRTHAQGAGAALRALALDEGLAEAHASLALIEENYDYAWP